MGSLKNGHLYLSPMKKSKLFSGEPFGVQAPSGASRMMSLQTLSDGSPLSLLSCKVGREEGEGSTHPPFKGRFPALKVLLHTFHWSELSHKGIWEM